MTASSATPIVVDLGKTKRKSIKRLKQGQGKLMEEVDEAVARVKAGLGDDGDDKVLVPVVIVYRRKRKKRRSAWPLALP